MKIEGLSVYADLINDGVWVMLLFLPRTLIVLQFWPLFSDLLTTQFLRASVAFALILLPASHYLFAPDRISLATVGILPYLIGEITIGLILGLLLSLPYNAVMAWGALIDVIRGATFATIINPASQTEDLILERIAGMCFTLWFISTPAATSAVSLLYDSYLKWPPSVYAAKGSWETISALIPLFNLHLEWAVRLLMPILFVIVIVEVALYIISAFVPNIQVYSIDTSLKTIICMGCLYITSLVMPEVWLNFFEEIQKSPFQHIDMDPFVSENQP